MKVEFNTGVYQVDVPLLRGRIPQDKRDEVLDAILDAASRYPLDQSTWEPLRGKLGGFYKVVFCSGLNNPDTKDMRMALAGGGWLPRCPSTPRFLSTFVRPAGHRHVRGFFDVQAPAAFSGNIKESLATQQVPGERRIISLRKGNSREQVAYRQVFPEESMTPT